MLILKKVKTSGYQNSNRKEQKSVRILNAASQCKFTCSRPVNNTSNSMYVEFPQKSLNELT